MNSHRKSDGKKFPVLGLHSGLLTFVLTGACFLHSGCSFKTIDRESPNVQSEAPAVDGAISLKEDRKHLTKLRKEIPAEVQQENDELAFMLNRLGEHVTDEPNKIRSKFDKEVRKKREKFRKKYKKVRTKYSKDERRRREDFSKAQKKARKTYLKDKHTSDERKEFFSDQADKRKDFFESEREKRKEFESDMRQKSNDFNSEMKETIRQFYQEWGIYSRKHRHNKKLKKEQEREKRRNKSAIFNKKSNIAIKKSPKLDNIQRNNYNDEFEEMKKVPSSSLSTGDR